MDTPGITSPLLPSKRRLFLQSAAASSMLTVIGKGWRNAHAQAKIQFPFPHYLPSGFSLQEQVSKPASGFGGDPELGLIYSKPGRDPVTHANWPLVLIASLNPTRPTAGTTNITAQSITLIMAAGTNIEGKYYDGFWVLDPNGEATINGHRLRWDTTDLHTITFIFHGFTIAIRGPRSKGVTQAELVRIAESVY